MRSITVGQTVYFKTNVAGWFHEVVVKEVKDDTVVGARVDSEGNELVVLEWEKRHVFVSLED